MLTIWGRFDSSNVQALMWCVAELGLPYQRFDVGDRFGGTDTEQFLAMNPNGTVPVLRDDDGPALWETGAILRYLASRYAPAAFWPADLTARALVDRWADWAKLNVALRFTAPLFWRVVRTPQAKQDATAVAAALETLNRSLIIADTQLANHAFLACDTLTLADIQFGHILFRYFTIPIEPMPLPHLQAYYDRLTQRPAFQQHVMVSYEALRA